MGNRRTFLRSAAAATGVTLAAGAPATAAADHRRAPTLVFIHGTNSSSFWWSGLIRELTLRGHRALAVDLPGHGAEAFFQPRTRHPRISRPWPPSRHRWRG